MQLRLPWRAAATSRRTARPDAIEVDGRLVPLVVSRHRWARRYLLRVLPDGRLRLTVPRGASLAGGLAFARTEQPWIADQIARHASRGTWRSGHQLLLGGEPVTLIQRADGHVRVGDEVTTSAAPAGDLRATVEAHLRSLAERELPTRCASWGAEVGLRPARVSVRNQRSRWGACSSKRVITLNWRLIQMPPAVADYVILHELAHLEHPNHGRRFWRKVASMCEGWREAERWLRRHGKELM